MDNINYQQEMDRLLLRLEAENRVPSLLLHSCCGPCSSYVIEYLSRYFDITVLYYNPNIEPSDEYQRRLSEQKRLISLLPAVHAVAFAEGRYEPERYLERVRGLEACPEGGERCRACFALRLEETAKLAGNFDYFATTLTVSPHKNVRDVNSAGFEAARVFGGSYLPSDFKKHAGYQRSIELSRLYSLYRQDFCGCRFSKRPDADGE